jgi:predicted PurR-regulated permease PerM
MPSLHQDLTRTTLAVLFIGGLIAATLWVLWPFLPAIVWAMTLVVSTWPLMLQVQRYAGNRRSLAVLAMTAALLLIVIVPLWLAIATVIENIDEIGELSRAALLLRLPSPPEWLAEVPLVGSHAAQAWRQFAAANVGDLAPRLTPYAGYMTRWVAGAVGGLGLLFLQFLLVVVIAAIMFAQGERAAASVIRFAHRLAGERGKTTALLAGHAIRGVALGVVVTAIAQSLLGGISLAVVGFPFATVLTAVMFILCLAQIGPGLVLIPAVAWMYWSGELAWGTVLVGFSVVTLTMDNFLRPILIRRGANLPMLLILVGVIGGLIAFGLLGIFVGPTVLAVAYTLLNAWVDEDETAEVQAQPQRAQSQLPQAAPSAGEPGL